MKYCPWFLGKLGKRVINCGQPIEEKYRFCYGHEIRARQIENEETSLDKAQAELNEEKVDSENKAVPTLNEIVISN